MNSKTNTTLVTILDNGKVVGSADTDTNGNFSYTLTFANTGNHDITAKAGAELSSPWTVVNTTHKEVIQNFGIYDIGSYPSGLDTQYISFTREPGEKTVYIVPEYPTNEGPPRSLQIYKGDIGTLKMTMKKITHNIVVRYLESIYPHKWVCNYADGAIDERIVHGMDAWTTITFSHPNITSLIYTPSSEVHKLIHRCLLTVED